MCVVVLAWKAHPRWQLVVAANRDELHARSAAPIARWTQHGHVIGGTDLKSGGSWLGISERGRFVAVTNLRGFGDPQPDRTSRGELVADMLSGEGEFADPSGADLSAFNPFNLITATPGRAEFYTNRPIAAHSALGPGAYGLSNGELDQPWPKTTQLKASLLGWLIGGAEEPEELLDPLRSETLPEFGVPVSEPSDVPQEPTNSPIFIHNPVYGTRCSTVVAIDYAGRGTIIERRFDADGQPIGQSSIAFSWPRMPDR